MSRQRRQRKAAKRRRRIQQRLAKRHWDDQPKPMFSASNIDYDVADRTRALGVGGIGAMHVLARQTGLIERIDERLHLFISNLQIESRTAPSPGS